MTAIATRRGGERRTEAAARIAARVKADRQRHQAALKLERERAAQPQVHWLPEPVLLAPDYSNLRVVGVCSDASDKVKREFLGNTNVG